MGAPPVVAIAIPCSSPDDILLATWSADAKTREVFRGSSHGDNHTKAEKLFKEYDDVVKELKRTYPKKGR